MPFGALIVDDQEDVRMLIRMIIEAANRGLFVSGTAATGREAVARVEELEPDVVVLDQMMPEMNGLEAAKVIRSRRPGQIMILCSAFLDQDLRAEAEAVGITVCLPKADMPSIPDVLHRLASKD